MDNLTLDQVREAGRFAWHREEYLFVPNIGVLSVTDEYDCDEQQGWEDVGAASERYAHRWAAGWHHLPGCDCGVCRS